jgi:hypothetical protein
MHPDLEDHEAWADETERDEEPKRTMRRPPDILSEEEELSLWVSL